MDPSAHFNHSELRSDGKFDRGWQKLGIDRVTNCAFDPSGRFCAIYFNHSSIELWDFTSVPVPMTMLLLPKNISGRFEGVCHSLVWSTNGASIIGVFGIKPISRRRLATTESESVQTNNEELRTCHLVVWNIASRAITHKYKLPFAVNLVSPLQFPELHDYYMLSTTFGNQQLLLDVATGKLQPLRPTLTESLPCTVPLPAEPLLLQNLADCSANPNLGDSLADMVIIATLDSWASAGDVSAPSSALLCTADLSTSTSQASSMLFLIGHNPENKAGADVLYAVRVTSVDNTPHFTLVTTAPLTLPCRVTHLAVDPDNQQLSATAENGHILTYSLRKDGDLDVLVPVVQHRPTDRSLTELLNSQSAADSLRSQHKQHSVARASGHEHKKTAITLPGNTTFRTFGASFFQYSASQYLDDTRFTNSLKPHTLVYPNHTSDATASLSSAAGSAAASTRPISRVGSSASIRESDASHHKTGLLYAVQGYVKGAGTAKDSTSDFLLLWELDHAPLNAATLNCAPSGMPAGSDGANMSVTKDRSASVGGLSGERMKCIELPRGGIQQLYVSPATSRSATRSSVTHNALAAHDSPSSIADLALSRGRANWRSSRQAPRQVVLCLDLQGRLWSLQTTYRTDFPGPMYPVGYTLITRVIKYTETESELDIVAPASSSAVALTNGHAGSSSVMLYSQASNSSKTSREDLVGLYIDSDEPAAKRSKTDTNGSHPHTHHEVQGAASSSQVQVVPHSSKGPGLPFTFVQDYYIVPAAGASAVGGTNSGSSAAVLQTHGSPSRSPRVPATGLINGTPGAFASPLAPQQPPSQSVDAAGDAQAAESGAAEEVTWSFDEMVPPPVRVLNGDFDAKLGRQMHAADVILQVMGEPARLPDKLKQIQVEAVQAAIHAEQSKERARMRSAVKKQQKEAEAMKASQDRHREMLAAMLLSGAQQPDSSAAPAGLPYGGDHSLAQLAHAVYGATSGASSSAPRASSNVNVASSSSSRASMPPPSAHHSKLHELMQAKGARGQQYLPNAPVITKKITMPAGYNQHPPRAQPQSSVRPVPAATATSSAAGGIASAGAPSVSSANLSHTVAPSTHAASHAVSQAAPRAPPQTPQHAPSTQSPPPQAPAMFIPTTLPLSPAQHMELYNFLMGGSAIHVPAPVTAPTVTTVTSAAHSAHYVPPNAATPPQLTYAQLQQLLAQTSKVSSTPQPPPQP